ncbi:tetratricopeptide repeat protein [Aureimonas psammosilenae]|uniref:tetratricopeptide repeat protein n=1 Tax=Aureimonas psammosilenae TaxID=2495496 RepID=UPI00186A7FEA
MRKDRPLRPSSCVSPRMGLIALSMILGLSLAGCQSVSPMHTGSIRSSAAPGKAKSFDTMNEGELRAATERYGAAYERDPKNKAIGLPYASLLQMTGRNDQSLAVMRQVAIANSKDREVLAAYGKSLAAAGELTKALETVRRAQTPDYPDWRLLSTEGAILDQLGKPEEARIAYRKALDIQPNEPAILSNLGMSFLLANDLKSAETTLSQAAARPGADSRVRQNLALVVGLQGRFEEAERIAGAELPPEEASANVAYLRQMLSQRNTWSMLKDKDKTPSAAQ